MPSTAYEVFDDVDDQYHAWYTLFMDVVNLHAPLKTKKCRKRMIPWMTSEIRELMRQRDKTHRIATKTKSEVHFQLYRSMRNNVNSQLRRAKKEYIYHLLLKESPTLQAFWKNIKQVIPTKHQVLNSLLVNGHLCYDPLAIANALNDHFVNIGPALNRNR